MTKNFKIEEFIDSRFYDDHSQSLVWDSYEENKDELKPMLQKLANQLQVLRNHLERPININIGYRPVWWEHQTGRSGSSKHCLGMAADIVVDGLSPDSVADAIEYLIEEGEMLQGGLGRYNTFTHYDIRKGKGRWDFRHG
jgi:uncharacterized protein YcbK (DUF882 family)